MGGIEYQHFIFIELTLNTILNETPCYGNDSGGWIAGGSRWLNAFFSSLQATGAPLDCPRQLVPAAIPVT